MKMKMNVLWNENCQRNSFMKRNEKLDNYGKLENGEFFCGLIEAFGNGKWFSDVLFQQTQVNGQLLELKAHKAILSARSVNFKLYFQNCDSGKTVYLIERHSFHVFSDMVWFIYTGQIFLRSEKHRQELEDIAAEYSIDGLLNVCRNEYFKVGQVHFAGFHDHCKYLATELFQDFGMCLYCNNPESLKDVDIFVHQHRQHHQNEQSSPKGSAGLPPVLSNIRAHRVILMASSKYFRRVLLKAEKNYRLQKQKQKQNQNQKQKQNQKKHYEDEDKDEHEDGGKSPPFAIRFFSESNKFGDEITLKLLLSFYYCGHSLGKAFENVFTAELGEKRKTFFDLYHLVCLHNFSLLLEDDFLKQKICKQFLKRRFYSCENIGFFYDFSCSKVCSDVSIKKKCLGFILENMDSLAKSPSITRNWSEKLVKKIVSLLMDNFVKIRDEDSVNVSADIFRYIGFANLLCFSYYNDRYLCARKSLEFCVGHIEMALKEIDISSSVIVILCIATHHCKMKDLRQKCFRYAVSLLDFDNFSINSSMALGLSESSDIVLATQLREMAINKRKSKKNEDKNEGRCVNCHKWFSIFYGKDFCRICKRHLCRKCLFIQNSYPSAFSFLLKEKSVNLNNINMNSFITDFKFTKKKTKSPTNENDSQLRICHRCENLLNYFKRNCQNETCT